MPSFRFSSKPGPIVKVGVLISVAAAVAGAHSPAEASYFCPDGFLGYCAPKNWEVETPGNGSVKFIRLLDSVLLTSTNDKGKSKNSFVTMELKALAAGVVSFDYKYLTLDKGGPEFDPFGYILNGEYNPLVPAPYPNKGGFVADSFSFKVATHDTFGFYAESLDSKWGPSITKIYNFSYVPVEHVPGPVPFLGAAAAFGFSRRLKSRIRERDSAPAVRG
jgi:hypothetical protein